MGHLIEFLIQPFVQLQTYDSNASEIVSLAGILVKESFANADIAWETVKEVLDPADSAMYVD